MQHYCDITDTPMPHAQSDKKRVEQKFNAINTTGNNRDLGKTVEKQVM